MNSINHPKGAATWDAVLLAVRQGGARGITNQQIANQLLLDLADVSALTRLICKAGLISVRREQITNVYLPCQKGGAA